MGRRQQRQQQKRAREDIILSALRTKAEATNPNDVHSAIMEILKPYAEKPTASTNNGGEVVAAAVEGAADDKKKELISKESLLRMAREVLFAAPEKKVDDKEAEEGKPREVDEGDIDRLIAQCRSNVATKGKAAAPKEEGASSSAIDFVRVGDLCWLASMQVNVADARAKRIADGKLDNSTITTETSALLKHYNEHKNFKWTDASDNAVDGQESFTAFTECAKTPLPMSFRLHSAQPALRAMADHILADEHIAKGLSSSNGCGGTIFENNKQVDALACSHEKYHSDEPLEYACRTLHSGSAGCFQELVSMLPVAALNIQPHHRVLDMCAAPGSKTLQALDATMPDGAQKCHPDGLVIANEKDKTKATQTLPARLKRHHSPNVILTKCDASQLPAFIDPAAGRKFVAQDAEAGSEQAPTSGNARMLFDRIVCDVPCSGDGTARKERSVFFSWTPSYAESLVPIQKSIIRRGFEQLKPGGIMAYSTCSLNPAEDEAVVLALIKTFTDDVELLDVNELLANTDVQLHSSGGILLDEAELTAGPEGCPPATACTRKFDMSLLQEIQKKVLRVFPHKNNTGGFFVAAIKKREHRPPQPLPPKCLDKLGNWAGYKRWERVHTSTDANWQSILDFYGMDQSKNALVPVYHVTPAGDKRRICLTTKGASAAVFDHKLFKGPGVELVTMGMRAFEMYDGRYLAECKCRWRATYEGASWLAEVVGTSRKFEFDVANEEEAAVCEALLKNGNLSCEEIEPIMKNKLAATVASSAEKWSAEGVGGYVIGIRHPTKAPKTWWLAGTFNGRKLELTVDVSVKVMALWALFGVKA